ncbi:hypothetical protein [Lewinella cohaerens]|uniref:hypothetical protein n=1 Tax=Lewinella cohaerens TaxID=70995 RepID=UPI0003696842|nr:hypothetical protein [Lewinella cohaerens]
MKSIVILWNALSHIHINPVKTAILTGIFAIISLPSQGSAQTKVITGYWGVNQYSHWYKNEQFTYRTYVEDNSGTGVISLALLKAHEKKRRSVELSVLRRTLTVSTYAGGLAGGISHEINMDLTYMNLSGFVGRRLTKTMPLYFDMGGYLGVPLARTVVDNYNISTPTNNSRGTNYDPNEYLNKLEFGIIIKAGFQFMVSDKIAISTALRLNCGIGGKESFNHVAFDQMAMIGVGYILTKQQ